jgi:hypothetical protein
LWYNASVSIPIELNDDCAKIKTGTKLTASIMGGKHRSSTIGIIVVIVLTTTFNLLLLMLPSPLVSSFVLRPSSSHQAMSSSYAAAATTSLYVSRKDRYSSIIINRSRDSDSESRVGSNHRDRRRARPFATAAVASDTTSSTRKKGGGGAIMEDHWSDLYHPTVVAASDTHHHQQRHASSSSSSASSLCAGVIIPIQNEIDIVLLHRHLMEGIIEHQALVLDSTTTVVYHNTTLEQSPIQLDVSNPHDDRSILNNNQPFEQGCHGRDVPP